MKCPKASNIEKFETSKSIKHKKMFNKVKFLKKTHMQKCPKTNKKCLKTSDNINRPKTSNVHKCQKLQTSKNIKKNPKSKNIKQV